MSGSVQLLSRRLPKRIELVLPLVIPGTTPTTMTGTADVIAYVNTASQQLRPCLLVGCKFKEASVRVRVPVCLESDFAACRMLDPNVVRSSARG